MTLLNGIHNNATLCLSMIKKGGGKWWQRGVGGGARRLGGMVRTSGRGHRVEGKGQGTMEGNGTDNNKKGLGKDMERVKAYDRG